jgi:hypothetical protein
MNCCRQLSRSRVLQDRDVRLVAFLTTSTWMEQHVPFDTLVEDLVASVTADGGPTEQPCRIGGRGEPALTTTGLPSCIAGRGARHAAAERAFEKSRRSQADWSKREHSAARPTDQLVPASDVPR